MTRLMMGRTSANSGDLVFYATRSPALLRPSTPTGARPGTARGGGGGGGGGGIRRISSAKPGAMVSPARARRAWNAFISSNKEKDLADALGWGVELTADDVVAVFKRGFVSGPCVLMVAKLAVAAGMRLPWRTLRLFETRGGDESGRRRGTAFLVQLVLLADMTPGAVVLREMVHWASQLSGPWGDSGDTLATLRALARRVADGDCGPEGPGLLMHAALQDTRHRAKVCVSTLRELWATLTDASAYPIRLPLPPAVTSAFINLPVTDYYYNRQCQDIAYTGGLLALPPSVFDATLLITRLSAYSDVTPAGRLRDGWRDSAWYRRRAAIAAMAARYHALFPDAAAGDAPTPAPAPAPGTLLPPGFPPLLPPLPEPPRLVTPAPNWRW